MKFFYNIFITSIHNIWNNKARSFLTVLGIVIGIAAFIVMLAIGRGAKEFVTKEITKLGSNLIFVMPEWRRSGGVSSNRSIELTVADGQYIGQTISEVVDVAPEKRFNKQVKFYNNNVPLSIIGSTEKIFSVLNLPLESGRYFSNTDVSDNSRVCVLGNLSKKYLFGNLDAVGKTVKIEGLQFKVIGVVQELGGGWRSPDERVYVPITIAMRRFSQNRRQRSVVNMIYIKLQNMKETSAAVDKIEKILRKRHRIMPGGQDDFRIFTQQEILGTYMKVTQTLNYLLISIAIISLLVGGIGIMNIMLVTVTERTKEIGLRKAVGATNHAILTQFLTESVVLSLLGGLIGIALGISAAEIISKTQNWMIVLDGFTIVIGVIFALAVGVFFGVYPARKASRLNPIEALRYE